MTKRVDNHISRWTKRTAGASSRSITKAMAMAVEGSGRTLPVPSFSTVNLIISTGEPNNSHPLLSEALSRAASAQVPMSRLTAFLTTEIIRDGLPRVSLLLKTHGFTGDDITRFQTALTL